MLKPCFHMCSHVCFVSHVDFFRKGIVLSMSIQSTLTYLFIQLNVENKINARVTLTLTSIVKDRP
jgi:hypothetical protein